MWRRTWLVFSQAVTVALALLFVVTTLKPEWLPGRVVAPGGTVLPLPTLSVVPPAPRASDAPLVSGYSRAAERAAPAVVSIVATKMLRRNPHLDDPALRFHYGDRQQQPQLQTGLGSGVIVSPEGYLLTNNHVIEGADEIEVQLADGRQGSARIIGTDPDTDLAVLKIDLDGLPVLSFGDTTGLRVGDAVLAIGNPFNVGQTVTAGIVSALGRTQLRLSTFENFIQTDAAINPGNSGGALVDAEGHLVGINTAIFARSGGGSLGIGFAIPADTARNVLDSLVRHGKVTRGWIGVELRELTPELVEALGLPVSSGVLITGVLQQGPASKGGLRPSDVVLSIDAQPVANVAQLLTTVTALQPGSEAKIGVRRGRETLELTVGIAERPRLERREPR
jgi:serine protease DegQ